MRELTGDLWSFHMPYSHRLIIPTNGFIKRDGSNVMGKGLAWDAKTRYRHLPMALGRHLQLHGNVPVEFPKEGLITFPVKYNWFDEADLGLIELSCGLLRSHMKHSNWARYNIFMPRVGCGNGGLKWQDVKPIIEATFEDTGYRITLVSHPSEV